MKTAVGLWLDHRQAVIVSVAGHAETTQLDVKRAFDPARRPD
jgi:hypothetical protein